MVLSHLKMVEQRRKTDDERHQALSLVLSYHRKSRHTRAKGRMQVVKIHALGDSRWLILEKIRSFLKREVTSLRLEDSPGIMTT